MSKLARADTFYRHIQRDEEEVLTVTHTDDDRKGLVSFHFAFAHESETLTGTDVTQPSATDELL